jgi:hypothetical protein
MTTATLTPVFAWSEADTQVLRPGVYTGLPDTVYHSDPVPGGSLSSSGARKLQAPSCPALYRYEQDNGRPPNKTFDMGHAAHQRVLGVGPEIVKVEADDWRTKAARETRDAAYLRGAVPLLSAQFDVLEEMAEAIAAHPIAQALFKQGEGLAEVSMFWPDEATGVMRRSRLDWLPTPGDRRTIIADYKTSKSADPEQFAKDAMNYGYHQQADWYRDGVITLGIADDPAFVFVVQEKTPPYLVSVIELDVIALRIGRLLNRRALNVYAECTRTGRWPGYVDDVELVSLPGYYENRYVEDI